MFTEKESYEYISQITNDKIIAWRICEWTGESFPIFESEKKLLDTISPIINGKKYNISLPDLCPEARQIQRMLFRNDRIFYKSEDSLYQKPIISIYPESFPGQVYEVSSWYKDLDASKINKNYEKGDNISQIMHELNLAIPRLNVDGVGNENSDYCNYCGYCKNCYLDIAGENNEDCYYCTFTKYSTRCVDCTFTYSSKWCYESLNIYNSNKIINSQYIEDASNCYFSFDLKNCHNCLWCHNLKGKKYHIFNKPVKKEYFEKIVGKIFSGSYTMYKEAVSEYNKIKKDFIYRDSFVIASENSVGDNIKNAQNSKFIYNASNIDTSMYLYDVLDASHCLDLNYSLYHPEYSYNLMSTLELKKSIANVATHHSHHVYYCQICNHCDNCFGCIGLNNKSYCIFNKQYSKEEYFKKLEYILQELIDQNTFGRFFNESLSFHPYNDTFAMDYFPIKEALIHGKIRTLNKSGVGKVIILEPEKFISKAILDLGGTKKIHILWRTKDKEINVDESTRKITNLADNISDNEEKDILNKIIICKKSQRPFKLIAGEIKFYKKMGLPLPRIHYNIRHEERNKNLTSRNLEIGNCSKSKEKIIFSKKPIDKAKVYSKESYNLLFE